MLDKKKVLNELEKVIDPELGINIVDLGLVYDVKINNDDVIVVMTLTTPGCPMGLMFDQEVVKIIKKIKGVKKVKVELTFDPPWTPERISPEAKKKLNYG